LDISDIDIISISSSFIIVGDEAPFTCANALVFTDEGSLDVM
jgi:hypothetical protein